MRRKVVASEGDVVREEEVKTTEPTKYAKGEESSKSSSFATLQSNESDGLSSEYDNQ